VSRVKKLRNFRKKNKKSRKRTKKLQKTEKAKKKLKNYKNQKKRRKKSGIRSSTAGKKLQQQLLKVFIEKRNVPRFKILPFLITKKNSPPIQLHVI
jgi:hypothetical protein